MTRTPQPDPTAAAEPTTPTTGSATRRPRSRARSGTAWLGGALLAVVLTACGTGAGSPSPAAGGSEEQDAGDGDGLGVIERLVGDLYGGDAEARAAQGREVEERTATCMADAGFEYVPTPRTADEVAAMDEALVVELGDRERVEQYGYGITTNPGADVLEGRDDPNEAIVGAMSDAERAAYDAALYGGPDAGPTDGCWNAAYEAVHRTAAQIAAAEEHGALLEDLNRYWLTHLEDERVLEAAAAWSDCMADAGHPGFTRVDEAAEQVYAETDAIDADEQAALSPEPSDEELEVYRARVQERYATITESEIRLATADLDCRESTGYDRVVEEVDHEYQAAYYDEHRADVDAYVAAVGEATAAQG